MDVVYAMLQDVHGQSPIMIDQSLLCDHEPTIRVHPCDWENCTMHVALDQKHVSKHLQQRHGVNTSATSENTQKEPCRWLNCIHAQMKPGNMARHVLSAHLGVRWNCQTCGRLYTREDAFRRHTQEKESCQFAKYEISYENGVREICTDGISEGWSIDQNVMCIP